MADVNRVLERLANELKAWRSENSPAQPLPAQIWSDSAKVAKRAGVWPVAKALRLDYSKLKRLTREGQQLAPPSPTFAELLPMAGQTLGDCAIEIESPHGARMRIQILNANPSGLAGLIREFVS